MRTALPEVRQVTNIKTMWEALNKTPGEVQTVKVVFDITCGNGGFRAYIFCPLTTQELPKKHHEAGSSEQLPTYALSQIYYGHTGHC